MNSSSFNLGKTEVSVLKTVAKDCDEKSVIQTVLGRGDATSKNVVENAIERLKDKKLIAQNSNKLKITDAGNILIQLFG